jgi:hypothetical protein
MSDGATIDELFAEGRDVSAMVLHVLDHLPPGEVVPGECRLFEEPERWYLVAPDGTVYTHAPGAAWRSRTLPDGRGELVEFRDGEAVSRRVLDPREPDGG